MPQTRQSNAESRLMRGMTHCCDQRLGVLGSASQFNVQRPLLPKFAWGNVVCLSLEPKYGSLFGVRFTPMSELVCCQLVLEHTIGMKDAQA